eukprot:g1311.t1
MNAAAVEGGSDDSVREFESACEKFRTHATRAEAERYLVAFKNAPDAIDRAMRVLQRSSASFAKFQATCAVRDVVLRKWNRAEPKQRDRIRETLFRYAIERYDAMEPFLAKQILQTVAVFYKREWAESADPQFKTRTFERVAALLNAPKTIDCGNTFLGVLVGEFLSTRSSALGLRLEWHRKTRRAFESVGLQQCLVLGHAQTARFSAAPGVEDEPKIRAFVKFLKLFLQIMAFDFGGSGNESDSDSEIVCPGPQWRNALLGSGLAGTLFGTYGHLRRRKDRHRFRGALHLSREAMIRMASIRGDIFASDSDRFAYFSQMIVRTMHLLLDQTATSATSAEDVAFYGEELIDLCRVLRRVIENLGLVGLLRIPNAPDFFARTRALSCRTMRRAAATPGGVAQTWYCEAYDYLLDVWSRVALNASDADGLNSKTKSALAAHCAAVFEAFVSCRAAVVGRLTESDEAGDEHMLREQLDVAVSVGRFAAPRSAAMLDALLARCAQRYFGSGNTVDVAAMRTLRWAVRVAAHFLADEPEGEDPVVPNGILRDPATARLAAQIVGKILRVADRDAARPDTIALKREVLVAIRRVARTYLMPDVRNLYAEGTFPKVLVAAFGGNTDGGLGMLRFSVRYATAALGCRDLAIASVELLRCLSLSAGTRRSLVEIPEWQTLITRRGGRNKDALARLVAARRRVPRELTRALCRSASDPTQSRRCADLLARILGPLEFRLATLIAQCERAAPSDVLVETELVAQCFRGAVLATDSRSRACLVALCRRSFPQLCRLADSVHRVDAVPAHVRQHVLRAVVKVFRDASEALLPYVTDQSVVAEFCQHCAKTVDVFAARRYHLPGEDATDGRLLSAIVAMCRHVTSECLARGRLSAALVGRTLEIALPSATTTDMQLPKFQSNLFCMLRELCESDRGAKLFMSLSVPSLNALGRCLIFATELDDDGVASDAYRSIRALARAVSSTDDVANARRMRNFVVVVLKHVVGLATRGRLPKAGTALDAASNALLALLSTASDAYRSVVIDYLNQQRAKDPSSYGKLATAFTKLTAGVDLRNAGRSSQRAFLEKLKAFMFEIEGVSVVA